MAGDSSASRHRRHLRWAMVLVLLFLIVEVVAALSTGSLALLGDAGHLLTDVVGLGMALGAIEVAARSGRRGGHTFGLHRLEVLAALANALLLVGLSAFILFESIRRFRAPPEVAGLPVFVVAAVAIVVNLVVLVLLRSGARESLNLEGAFLEVLADLVSSIGVMAAGIVLLTTGWPYVDPLVASAIGVWVLPRALRLGAKALRILLQAAPRHLPPERLGADLGRIVGVDAVHHLHVWTLTSGMEVVSAHLDLARDADGSEVLATARRMLTDEHGIEHATLQVEPAGERAPCREVSW